MKLEIKDSIKGRGNEIIAYEYSFKFYHEYSPNGVYLIFHKRVNGFLNNRKVFTVDVYYSDNNRHFTIRIDSREGNNNIFKWEGEDFRDNDCIIYNFIESKYLDIKKFYNSKTHLDPLEFVTKWVKLERYNKIDSLIS